MDKTGWDHSGAAAGLQDSLEHAFGPVKSRLWQLISLAVEGACPRLGGLSGNTSEKEAVAKGEGGG